MLKFLTLPSQCQSQPAKLQFYALCAFPCGKKEEKLMHIQWDRSGKKPGEKFPHLKISETKANCVHYFEMAVALLFSVANETTIMKLSFKSLQYPCILKMIILIFKCLTSRHSQYRMIHVFNKILRVDNGKKMTINVSI